jgi:heme-NO-binding protein
MKGVVFNLLEAVVTSNYGADTWDSLLDAAGVGGAYSSLGNYDDAEIEALVAAACRALNLNRGEVLRWFGREAMPVLAEMYPEFFEPHAASRPFVAGVNDVIHAEVRKLYAGAACPHFGIREDDDGAMTMRYQSSRRMCALAVGFIEGAAARWCETIDIEHTACVDRGDHYCELKLRWIEATDCARAA